MRKKRKYPPTFYFFFLCPNCRRYFCGSAFSVSRKTGNEMKKEKKFNHAEVHHSREFPKNIRLTSTLLWGGYEKMLNLHFKVEIMTQIIARAAFRWAIIGRGWTHGAPGLMCVDRKARAYSALWVCLFWWRNQYKLTLNQHMIFNKTRKLHLVWCWILCREVGSFFFRRLSSEPFRFVSRVSEALWIKQLVSISFSSAIVIQSKK